MQQTCHFDVAGTTDRYKVTSMWQVQQTGTISLRCDRYNRQVQFHFDVTGTTDRYKVTSIWQVQRQVQCHFDVTGTTDRYNITSIWQVQQTGTMSLRYAAMDTRLWLVSWLSPRDSRLMTLASRLSLRDYRLLTLALFILTPHVSPRNPTTFLYRYRDNLRCEEHVHLWHEWTEGSLLGLNELTEGSLLGLNEWTESSLLGLNEWTEGSLLVLNEWTEGSLLGLN